MEKTIDSGRFFAFDIVGVGWMQCWEKKDRDNGEG